MFHGPLCSRRPRKPGYIHEAYSRFRNYSIANQLLALFQILERGMQPDRWPLSPSGKNLGETSKRARRRSRSVSRLLRENKERQK